MLEPVMQFAFNLALGTVLGALGGLFGIGGALIAIPVLSKVYGMEQHLAQGTALLMIAPNALIGFLRYRQKNAIEIKSTFWLCLLVMPSAAVGAHVAANFPATLLRQMFAAFLILLVLYFFFQQRTARDKAPLLGPRSMPLIGILSGAVSGFFTVGGGLVAVPVLVGAYSVSQTKAQGLALAMVIPGSLVALVTYAQAGHVDWPVGLPIALGGLVSVSWGVELAHRIAPRRLRLAFCAMLAAIALAMLAWR